MSSNISNIESVDLLTGLKFQTYFWISATSLLAYDYGITFDSELSLIWAAPWSLVKALFLLTRYLPFVEMVLILCTDFDMQISHEACQKTIMFTGWLYIFGVGVSEVIIMLRTWALWNCNRKVGVVLLMAFVGASICTLIVEAKSGRSLNVDFSDVFRLPGSRCAKPSRSSILVANFVVVIFLETLVLGLTIVKMIHQYRSSGHRNVWTGFMKVLYCDGIVFFVYMLGISLANLFLVPISSVTAKNVLLGTQRIFHAVLSVRVILHLREAHECDAEDARATSLPHNPSTVIPISFSSSLDL